MPPGALRKRPLDVVTACRAADVRILRLALDGLRLFVPFKQLHVITARSNFSRCQRALGDGVELLDEDALIPGMTLQSLRPLSLPGFPKGAGWYFQQLLKFAVAFREPGDDYCLIWDADTIPLRALQFFDAQDRMLLTTADEEHLPYFDTYRRLLREEPRRECSFISQHMIVQKSVLREMLAAIESNLPGEDHWAWKIMKNLEGSSTNLFSEYEMLGHYVKNHYPERVAFRQLPWLRNGSQETKGVPSSADLPRLGGHYAFAAFESGQMPLRSFVRKLRAWLGAK